MGNLVANGTQISDCLESGQNEKIRTTLEKLWFRNKLVISYKKWFMFTHTSYKISANCNFMFGNTLITFVSSMKFLDSTLHIDAFYQK